MNMVPARMVLPLIWRIIHDKRGALGVAILCATLALALVAPALPLNAYEVRPSERLLPPSPQHPLGTDMYGRDLLARIAYGARISLYVGVLSVLLAVLLGVPLGAVSGYIGGVVDEVLMRFSDALFSFPAIVLALAAMAMLGPSVTNLVLVLGVAYSPIYARLFRANTLVVKESAHVLSARAAGCGGLRILVLHIAPFCLPSVLAQATVNVASAILAEAGLSFLGLGVPPPTPSWGSILQESRSFLLAAPWYPLFPGLAIAFAILGFNFLGEVLREYIDPRLREVVQTWEAAS